MGNNENGVTEVIEESEDKFKDMREGLRDRADHFRVDIVKQVRNMVTRIRTEMDKTDDMDEDDREKAEEMLQGLEKAANYLEEHDIDDLSEEATESVRRSPWKALAIAFVVGVLFGWITKR